LINNSSTIVKESCNKRSTIL